jgi:endonuclease/exonuclease/phosphatase family metal-dependent hydrolase
MPGRFARPFACAAVALACLVSACSSPTSPLPTEPSADAGADAGAVSPLRAGSADTLDVGSWNIEWFGSPAAGPTNEELQARRVGEVLRDAELDLWQLSEVVSEPRFRELLAANPEYGGLLSSESRVENGSLFYTSNEQKVALVYRKATLRLLSARVVLTDYDIEFAGRPPMEARFAVTGPAGQSWSLTVLALHMKAGQDSDSWSRRQRAGEGLKRHLDARAPNEPILVVGDWNDDVLASLVEGVASPYAAFVADAERYAFTTRPLSEAGVRTMPYLERPVDHHLATRPMADRAVPGSAAALPVFELMADFEETVSDHAPVVSRYSF